jgi:hypothetical protein
MAAQVVLPREQIFSEDQGSDAGKSLDTKDTSRQTFNKNLYGSPGRFPHGRDVCCQSPQPHRPLDRKGRREVSGPRRHRILVRIVGNHMLFEWGPRVETNLSDVRFLLNFASTSCRDVASSLVWKSFPNQYRVDITYLHSEPPTFLRPQSLSVSQFNNDCSNQLELLGITILRRLANYST